MLDFLDPEDNYLTEMSTELELLQESDRLSKEIALLLNESRQIAADSFWGLQKIRVLSNNIDIELPFLSLPVMKLAHRL